MTSARRRGAGRVVDALLGAGVRQVFTLSGNHVLSLYVVCVVGNDARWNAEHQLRLR